MSLCVKRLRPIQTSCNVSISFYQYLQLRSMKTYNRICSWDAVFVTPNYQYDVKICKIYICLNSKRDAQHMLTSEGEMY